jgi:hypothetical protein
MLVEVIPCLERSVADSNVMEGAIYVQKRAIQTPESLKGTRRRATWRRGWDSRLRLGWLSRSDSSGCLKENPGTVPLMEFMEVGTKKFGGSGRQMGLLGSTGKVQIVRTIFAVSASKLTSQAQHNSLIRRCKTMIPKHTPSRITTNRRDRPSASSQRFSRSDNVPIQFPTLKYAVLHQSPVPSPISNSI